MIAHGLLYAQASWVTQEGTDNGKPRSPDETRMYMLMAAATAVAETLIDSLLELVRPHSVWGAEYDDCIGI